MIIVTCARSTYKCMSIVQRAQSKRAHIVRVQNTPTPDATHVLVSDEVYDTALKGMHGERFQEGVR